MTLAAAEPKSVAVVGGGLAGLAAGCALADAGYRVRLFERRPYLGGRASSYEHPGTGEVVDNCQHVLLGCCTNLIELYQRTGVADKIRWYDRLVFVEPGGRKSVLSPGRLPAPFHSSLSFLRTRALGVRDKVVISRAMATLAREEPVDDGKEDFLSWLRRHQQTPRAIDRFWKVVLVSALNEELDRMSVRYAAQVFRESFLKSPEAARMGVPRVPLSDLYRAAGDYIRARGGEVQMRTAVESFRAEPGQVRLCVGGREVLAEFAICAVPFDALERLLPNLGTAEQLRVRLEHFETSPITGIHLWFDREITRLDHAVLLDRTIQWMFHKSRLLGRKGEGSYVELVVSSSRSLVQRSRAEITELALRELAEFFPRASKAKLLKSTVIKEVHATYSARPGVDAYRPGVTTPWPRVFLAGDWVATGWPATMEGAVRSGYMAAEALVHTAGADARFLAPDLPAAGFMRLLP